MTPAELTSTTNRTATLVLDPAAQKLKHAIARVREWRNFPKANSPESIPLAKWSKEAFLLARAVTRNPAMGVYGESQAGKSFLISSLATGGTTILVRDPSPTPIAGRCWIVNDDAGKGCIDFLKHLNPQNDKESTGLITRFTSTPSEVFGLNKQAFVAELMNYEDLILAMVAGVEHDVEAPKKEDDAAFRTSAEAVLKRLKESIGSATESPKNSNIMESVVIAWNRIKADGFLSRRIDVLEQLNFLVVVDEYARKAVRPSDELVVKCVSLLWGGEGSEVLCELFARLHRAILSLDGFDMAEISVQDVVLQTAADQRVTQTSMLNVSILESLGRSSNISVFCRMSDDPRANNPTNGRGIDIGRAELAGLISEIVLPVHIPCGTDSEGLLISHGDIVDFPGSRAKGQMTPLKFLDAALATTVFMRGKLMQIYRKLVDQNEIGALCLAVSSQGNTEAAQPTQIAVVSWLERQRKANVADPGLIAVITKSDVLLVPGESAERGDAVRVFENPMKKLSAYSPKEENWIERWPHKETEEHRRFSRTIFVFNPTIGKGSKFREPLEQFLLAATECQSVRAHCRLPDPWLIGLGGRDHRGELHGNLPSLKAEVLDRLRQLDRVSILRNEMRKLLEEIKIPFASRFRPSTSTAEQWREVDRQAEADKQAIAIASGKSFRGAQNGMAELQQAYALDQGLVERAVGRLRKEVEAGSLEIDEDEVYRFVHEDWKRKLGRGMSVEATRSIERLFGSCSTSVQTTLGMLPECPRFRDPCKNILRDRLALIATPRQEAAFVAFTECWNSLMVDWGFAVEDDALEGGRAPFGDTTKHPGRWMLDHWAKNIVELQREQKDPKGEPPPDNDKIKAILDAIDEAIRQLDEIAPAGNP